MSSSNIDSENSSKYAIRSNTPIRHTLDELFLLSFLCQVLCAKNWCPADVTDQIRPNLLQTRR